MRHALLRWNRDRAAWQRRADAWLEDLAAKGRTVDKDMDAARSAVSAASRRGTAPFDY